MNGKELLLGMGHIKDEYIQEAEEKEFKKPFHKTLKCPDAAAVCPSKLNKNIVEGAKTTMKKKMNWKVWGAAVAACLCLVAVTFGVPHISNLIGNEQNIASGNVTTDNATTKITFEAKVLEVQDGALIVEPSTGTQERELAEQIRIDTENLAELDTVEYVQMAQVGDMIKIDYLKEYSDISKGEIAVYKITPIDG